jgi:uncharacterized BrkB/YihY/UPF0761 family membrane protein
VGEDQSPWQRELHVLDGNLIRERIRRIIFGFLLFLVLLIALTLLLQAIEDSPGDEVRTVTT